MKQHDSHTDALLVEGVKASNEKAFRGLFDLYYNDVYGYSMSLLKNKELAEENVQEVFLKIWLHRETLDADKSFKAFLFTIARNQAFNALNKAAHDTALKEEVFYTSQQSYEQADYPVREDYIKKLEKQAIRELPPGRKKIFKMSRKKGMSYEEISTELGISVSTVKNQMSKALESLRVFLRAHDEYT
jgi:RNA polymerase sigma-70 factor (ECF subfamily)